jgi:tetratricopeptide (TPR) repeat protein
VWNDLGNIEEAISDLTEYLHLQPSNAATYAERARLWVEQEEFASSIADFDACAARYR